MRAFFTIKINKMEIANIKRVRAFLYHLFISCFIAFVASVIVFFIWYPDHLSKASGVNQVFLMLLAIDCALGPCITLIIFNPKKKELKWDLTIIGLVQITALLYGLHTMFVARPVYLVFNVDRFDVVYANDFTDEKLAKVSNPQFQHLPIFRPQIIAAQRPTDSKEKNALLFSVLNGGDDLPQLPQYYVSYPTLQKEVIAHAHTLSALSQFNPQQKEQIDNLVSKYQRLNKKVGFLPLKGKVDHLSVLVDFNTAEVQEIVDLKPW